MAKENKVEYERVDEKDDKYKRILVKFNPHFLRGSDFEIEFIPLQNAIPIGKVFVTEIDSMNSIDLYRWLARHTALSKGSKGWKLGTIPPKGEVEATAEYIMERWRKREAVLEPRQIISRVKQVYEGVAKGINKWTAYTYNHYLYTGELGSLPFDNKSFTIEELREIIEGVSYPCRNTDGDVVERPLVRHLFDTHKTKYVENVILFFLGKTCDAVMKAALEMEKEQ